MLIVFEKMVINLEKCKYFTRVNDKDSYCIKFEFVNDNDNVSIEFSNEKAANKAFINILKFRSQCAALCICSNDLENEIKL